MDPLQPVADFFNTLINTMAAFFQAIGLNSMLSISGVVFAIGTAIFFMEILGFTFTKRGIGRNWIRWDSTDIAMTAMLSAIYGGGLAATAGIVLIPGFTWVRPADALNPMYGTVFGVPGAVAAAVGNLIGDILSGTLSVGSIGGLMGQFFQAYVPYKMVRKQIDIAMKTRRGFVVYEIATFLGAIVVGIYISFFLDVLKILPSDVVWYGFAPFVIVPSGVLGLIIAPPIQKIVYPKVKAWGLFYQDRQVQH